MLSRSWSTLDRDFPMDAERRSRLQERIKRFRQAIRLDVLLDDYVANKKRPSDIDESLLLAELCLIKNQPMPAARFYATVFDSNKTANPLGRNYLRAAACAIEAALGKER